MKTKHLFGLFLGFFMILNGAIAIQTNPQDASMIMQAAKYKDFATIQSMMARGIDINFRDSKGNTLYCLAVKNNDKQTADVLKNFGGTTRGCPNIDPNYKPQRKTYYEEKSGAFADSKFGEYALIGGAVAGIAYFVGGGGDDGSSHDRSATTSGDDGTTPRPTNGNTLIIPADPVGGTYDPDSVLKDADDNPITEFFFTSAVAMKNGSHTDSHWDRIGLQNAFARGYNGDIVDRNSSGEILSANPVGKIKIAIVDTAGIDSDHPDFDPAESFAGTFIDGEKYDFTYQSNGNYDGTTGIPSPYYGDSGIDYIDSFATQTAGIIGASWDETGMNGIVPYASIQSYAIDTESGLGGSSSPFVAFNSAVDNDADVIVYTATKNLTFADGDGNAFFDGEYTAGALNLATNKRNYWETQIDRIGAYGIDDGDGDSAGDGTVGAFARSFYESFGSMAQEDRPIMVVSTGNDMQARETTIEAGAPIAFPELLGNFIAVTGVDSDDNLYRQYRTEPLPNTFGSNGCGLTMDWCLSAPADEVITTAGGTGNILNWENFDTATLLSIFDGNTNGGIYGSIEHDGTDWDDDASEVFDADYATSFFINADGDTGTSEDGNAISTFSSLFSPLDMNVYDVNRDGNIVGQRMDEGDLDWSVWGYKDDNGDWLAGEAEADNFVDFYFIDMDSDGNYTPGDYLYIPLIGSTAATAIVAGGAGLVKSAFPHMTNEQITALLFSTATDLGDAGVDQVFGHGLMNLDRAFQPFGEVIVPINWQTFDWNLEGGYTNPSTPSAPASAPKSGSISLAGTKMNLGMAFGDAGSNLNGLSFVGLDEFNRGFSYGMSNFVTTSATMPSLYEIAQNFGSQKTTTTQITDRVSFSMTTRSLSNGEMMSADDVPIAMKMTVDRDTSEIMASFGENTFSFFEEQGGETGAILRSEIVYNPFMALIDEKNIGARYSVDISDTWSVSSIFSYGENDYEDGMENDSYSMINQVEQEQYEGHVSVSMMRLSKTFAEKSVAFAFDSGIAYEEKTILGAVNEGAFQTDGGTTTQFYSMNFSAKPSNSVHLFAGYTHGISKVDVSDASFFTSLSEFESSAFHVGADYKINKKTSFGLIVAQPLRINKATAGLEYAVERDSTDNIFVVENQTINLTPTAHETDVQAFLTHKVDGLVIDAGVLYQHNPAHSAYLPDDTTGLVKFKWSLQ